MSPNTSINELNVIAISDNIKSYDSTQALGSFQYKGHTYKLAFESPTSNILGKPGEEQLFSITQSLIKNLENEKVAPDHISFVIKIPLETERNKSIKIDKVVSVSILSRLDKEIDYINTTFSNSRILQNREEHINKIKTAVKRAFKLIKELRDPSKEVYLHKIYSLLKEDNALLDLMRTEFPEFEKKRYETIIERPASYTNIPVTTSNFPALAQIEIQMQLSLKEIEKNMHSEKPSQVIKELIEYVALNPEGAKHNRDSFIKIATKTLNNFVSEQLDPAEKLKLLLEMENITKIVFSKKSILHYFSSLPTLSSSINIVRNQIKISSFISKIKHKKTFDETLTSTDLQNIKTAKSTLADYIVYAYKKNPTEFKKSYNKLFAYQALNELNKFHASKAPQAPEKKGKNRAIQKKINVRVLEEATSAMFEHPIETLKLINDISPLLTRSQKGEAAVIRKLIYMTFSELSLPSPSKLENTAISSFELRSIKHDLDNVSKMIKQANKLKESDEIAKSEELNDEIKTKATELNKKITSNLLKLYQTNPEKYIKQHYMTFLFRDLNQLLSKEIPAKESTLEKISVSGFFEELGLTMFRYPLATLKTFQEISSQTVLTPAEKKMMNNYIGLLLTHYLIGKTDKNARLKLLQEAPLDEFKPLQTWLNKHQGDYLKSISSEKTAPAAPKVRTATTPLTSKPAESLKTPTHPQVNQSEEDDKHRTLFNPQRQSNSIPTDLNEDMTLKRKKVIKDREDFTLVRPRNKTNASQTSETLVSSTGTTADKITSNQIAVEGAITPRMFRDRYIKINPTGAKALYDQRHISQVHRAIFAITRSLFENNPEMIAKYTEGDPPLSEFFNRVQKTLFEYATNHIEHDPNIKLILKKNLQSAIKEINHLLADETINLGDEHKQILRQKISSMWGDYNLELNPDPSQIEMKDEDIPFIIDLLFLIESATDLTFYCFSKAFDVPVTVINSDESLQPKTTTYNYKLPLDQKDRTHVYVGQLIKQFDALQDIRLRD